LRQQHACCHHFVHNKNRRKRKGNDTPMLSPFSLQTKTKKKEGNDGIFFFSSRRTKKMQRREGT